MATLDGPMNWMPRASSFATKAASSAMNPQPGQTASHPAATNASMTRSWSV